ncbi:TetR/AcrR family transcriptional regulator [Clostridium sp. UBA4548]|uniref:TetR/AcrR family transcriptional regulator n=1 Tax=Clostridium sp. UBA4548 TaxID=1946361 RepID=UPI0025BD8CB0|nr:TetR/AcrR family transcriptional regulator [Clostridium sp. UBA4548]
MQYQKDEVRKRIIEEALSEFNEKGYEGTSIRNIAKKSNTSVGNLYKYFKSKEELHENIVGSIYERFVDYIKQFHRVELNEKAEVIFYKLADEIMEIFNKNNVEISVLLNESKGTKYENCKNIFVDFITRIVTEKMQYELSLQGKKLEDNFIIYLISQSLVESIAIIVKKCSDGAEVRKLTINLIHIFYTDLINKLQTEDIK